MKIIRNRTIACLIIGTVMAFICFPGPGIVSGAKIANVGNKDLSSPMTPKKISPENMQGKQVQNAEEIEITKLSLDEPFSYNPKNRIDPFKPFLQKILPRLRKAKQALPLTPLQKFSRTELQNGLVAIIWGRLGKRALFQDSSGKGYIVQQGTLVGQNGIVKQILPDRLIIEETSLDSSRHERKREITLRLKRGKKGEL